jgi:hypothetical protein
MMINFHLSELLRSQSVSFNKPIEGQPEEVELVTPAERQKLRKQIADAMVREEWIPEAIHLVEEAKASSKTIQEEFLYEMKVLMHDSSLPTHIRH